MARSLSRSPRRRDSTESEDEGEGNRSVRQASRVRTNPRQIKRVKLERTEATEEPEDDPMDYDPSDLDDDEKNEQAFNAARARRGRYMGVSADDASLTRDCS